MFAFGTMLKLQCFDLGHLCGLPFEDKALMYLS